MSGNNIEQHAYDLSEKMDAGEIDNLVTYLKLIRHGMTLAAVQHKVAAVMEKEFVDVGTVKAAPASKAKATKAAPAKPPDDDEDVF
jgi:hypothetical protein